jgi:C-terminal processing protease CtpA/Prc
MPGDIVSAIDGMPVAKSIEQWKPFYNGSNDAAVLHDISYDVLRGPCGEVTVRAVRDQQELQLKAKRFMMANKIHTHDLPGPAFRLLSSDVAYLKLSSVKAADAAHYIESAARTKGLIVDIRNYPSEFVVFALGSLLVDRETPFARFTAGDVETPGAFHWTEPVKLSPKLPHYAGKIVILVDEMSKSQSEYTAMAFRASPNALIVGSTTAGADGNVSRIPLPGSIGGMISGIGVFYPDKRPTQRLGIIPDVEVKPTISGIRAGRDEVLEEALRQILGPSTPSAEIEKLAKP